MTLSDLFKYVKQLNNVNSKLGVECSYSIKISAAKSYEGFDCLNQTYKDLNTFQKALEEETYYTNVGDCTLELFETAPNIDDLEYETTFTGVTNGTHETVSSHVYIYVFKD